MTAIDPRIAERRRQVKEQGARHRLRWALAVIVVLSLGLGGWWLIQSPYLAVEQIAVAGAEHADVPAALARADLRPGMSVVWVRTGRVEAELRADPWVRDAAVEIDYPHVVEVTVLEHEPFATAATPDGWRLLAADGAVLEALAEPAAGLGVVEGAAPVRPGVVVDDPATQAGLRFLAGLPAAQRAGAHVTVSGPALVAVVAERTVVLGTLLDIEAKAAATAALLAGGIDEGWSLDVSAPGRPALVPPLLPSPPEPEVEDAAEGVPEGQGG